MKRRVITILILLAACFVCIFFSYFIIPALSAQKLVFICYPILFLFFYLTLEQTSRLKKLKKTAFYDQLTGLPNQTKFKIIANRLTKRNPDSSWFIVKFDIENFKMVNDIFSFETGDLILKTTVTTLQKIIQKEQISIPLICRVGEDQFLLMGFSLSYEETEHLRKKFEAEAKKEFAKILGSYKVDFKYGRYFLSDALENVDSIIEKVNMVHRLAKQKKDQVIYDYNRQIRDRAVRDITFINSLDAALEKREFKLYLQPKHSLKTGRLCGAEALVRWQLKNETIVSPSEFVPVFEKSDLIIRLDLYMLEQACRRIRFWLDSGIEPVTISVNFSKRHLKNPDFTDSLCAITDKYNIPHNLIEAEITESTMLDNEACISEVLEKLHSCDFALSMDDFGAGYSSLGLLKNITIDTIKLDKSFLTDGLHKTNAETIIESVVVMAKKIKLKTVAEGVETAEQVEFLKNIGCDFAQGFYYSKPMPMDEFEQQLKSGTYAD